MKNVTITLEEEVARWARMWAVRHNTSVSRLRGDMLEKRMQEEGFEAARLDIRDLMRWKPIEVDFVIRDDQRDRSPPGERCMSLR